MVPAVECTHGDQHLEHDAIALTFLFELKTCRKVSVECVPDALEYVRVAAVAAAIGMQDREKRARSMTGVVGVCCDKRRKTVFITIRGAGDAPHRVQSKVDEWEPVYIAQSCTKSSRQQHIRHRRCQRKRG